MPDFLSLTEIWGRTTGIYKDERFVYLRVPSETMPISLLAKKAWLASINKIANEPHQWSIGFWPEYLDYGVEAEDAKAGKEIRIRMNQIHHGFAAKSQTREMGDEDDGAVVWHSPHNERSPFAPRP